MATPEEIDIRFWSHYFLSRWYIFVIAVLLCVGSAFLYLRLTKPIYTTTATILLRDGAAADPLAARGYPFGGLSGTGPTVVDGVESISSKRLTHMRIK